MESSQLGKNYIRWPSLMKWNLLLSWFRSTLQDGMNLYSVNNGKELIWCNAKGLRFECIMIASLWIVITSSGFSLFEKGFIIRDRLYLFQKRLLITFTLEFLLQLYKRNIIWVCEIRLASPSKLSCQLHLSFTHAVSALVDLPGPEHLLKPERLSIYGSVGILSSKLRKT